ncbi:MAG TPA: TetR/AcrR family transcriptional regulator [Acidimicrobiales bacterium]|nr:TetR/AcrR family transcriptional regulator [Acidimicrobiales bacterium]
MTLTQEERKAETRTRLLAAAADLFAEHGIDAVSVDAVAEAAGRTSGAVYAHFGSKQGLLLALLDSWQQSFLAVLFAQVAVTDEPIDQLAAVWGNIGNGTDERVRRWMLLEHELWLRAARDPDVAAILRARNRETQHRSERELAWWAAEVGSQPVAAPDQLAVLVKALLNGLAMQQRVDPGSVCDDTAVAGLAALLGLGIEASGDVTATRAPLTTTTTPTRQEHTP